MPRFLLRLLPLAILVCSLPACDSDGDGADAVAGTYAATTFTADLGGGPVDLLVAGGSVEATLRADGSVSGRVFVPEVLAGGEENDLAFGGTYTVSGSTVRFQHEADTFVRDAEWTYADGTLRTETSVLTVVLERE